MVASGVFALFQKGYEIFAGINKAAQDIRNEFGYTRDMIADIESNISEMATDMAYLGVTTESAAAAYKAIAGVSGTITSDMGELAKDAAIYKQTMGVSETITAGIYEKMGGISDASQDTLRSSMLNIQAMSKMAGVAPTKVMDDIAKASGEILSATRGNANALVKGAIEAARLGLTISKVGSAMRQLLNFSESVNDEMTASVLLGKNFNFIELRRAAFAGDAVKTAQEQVKLLKDMGGIQGKNMFQIDAMAKALGLSVEDLNKMSFQQELLAKATPKVAAEYQKYLDMQKDSFDITKASPAEADARIEKLKKENQLQNDYSKMQNEIKQLTMDIYNILSPTISLIVTIIKNLAWVVNGCTTLGGILTKNNNILSWWGRAFMTIVTIAGLYIGKLLIMGMLSGKHIKDVLNMGNAWKNISKTFKDLKGNTSSFFGGEDKGVNLLKKARKRTPKLSTIKPPKPADGGISQIGKSASSVNWTNVLQGAAALLLLAAAVWVLSKAAQNFESVGVKGFSLMALTVAGAIAAMYAIGPASEAMAIGMTALGAAMLNPVFWLGVAGLAAFGLALMLVAKASEWFANAFKTVVSALVDMQNIDLSKSIKSMAALMGLFILLGTPIGYLAIIGAGVFAISMYAMAKSLGGMSGILDKTSSSFGVISNALSMFKESTSITTGIDLITESLVKLNEQLSEVGSNSGALDKIKDLKTSITAENKSKDDVVTGAIKDLQASIDNQGKGTIDALNQIGYAMNSGVKIVDFDYMYFTRKMTSVQNNQGSSSKPVLVGNR